MRVSVDTQVCNGCGICEVICPEVFRMETGNGRKRAAVLSDTVPEAAWNFCRDARDCCKPRAIAITEPEQKPAIGVGSCFEAHRRARRMLRSVPAPAPAG